MHRFTQNVIQAAKTEYETRAFDDVKLGSATALMSYFIETTGWSPNQAIVPQAIFAKWYLAGSQKTQALVQRAWNANRNRGNIVELSTLMHQLTSIIQINDGLEWEPILVFVGNELGTHSKWPELHNVRQFYPAVSVAAPATTPFPSTFQWVFEVNQTEWGKLNTGMTGIQIRTKNETAKTNQANDEFWHNKKHQEQMGKKP
jgi:hypothetical protein